MHPVDDLIETGLALLSDLVSEDPRLESEFASTRALFQQGQHPSRSGAERASSNRRHLEWFLLEHPSTTLGGVPIELLRDELVERADEDGERMAAILLGSRAGAFEVGSVDPGGDLLVGDLFSGARHPVEAPRHVADVRPGDLFVGRIYPSGTSDTSAAWSEAMGRGGGGAGPVLLRFSTAAACFRNPSLVRALRQDIERSRASRRGVLRIEQLELERLFFGDPEPNETTETVPVEPFSPVAAARDGLRSLGLGESQVAAAIAALREAAKQTPVRSDVVTEILNTWAFETQVDLGEGQRILAGLWQALVHAPAVTTGASTTTDRPSDPATSVAENEADAEERARRRAALGKFDSGRAAGENVEALFERLERDLGLADEPEEDTGGAIPDFPGVVSAMIEEYLWDARRTGSRAARNDATSLRPFARYGADLGVFENIGVRELVDYAGRWLLSENAVGDADAARAAIDALGRFCRWTEEHHGHPLWTPFASSWETLREDVPRLFDVRAPGGASAAGAAPFELEAVDGPNLRVHSLNAEPIELVRVDEGDAGKLRPGDILHLVVAADGTARVAAAYPGELRRLLEARAQNADQGS